jgi:predicted ribosome quality control (RQC) complex YloA/Tae2 family protein
LEELFRRARRLARAGEDLEAQRSIQVSQIEEADEAVARVEAGLADENLLALVERYVPREGRELSSMGDARSGAKGTHGSAATEKETRGPALPSGSFARRYTLPGGWEVWVGRSAAQNDELTHRVAGPRDLWFHARGAQGSHAILRISSGKGEPAKSVIEAAAAIAAFHSKARNSKLVPVAFTERRFVRKPRGAPPGTASMDREKVLFVEPRVPKEAAEDA